jgi:hypothetical protein
MLNISTARSIAPSQSSHIFVQHRLHCPTRDRPDPTTPPTRDANDAHALDSIVDVFVDDITDDDDASTRDETFPSKQRLLRSPNHQQ